jgi:ABC-type bacteriocin/lantibiotic exporter with double-glycine peptidase domain
VVESAVDEEIDELPRVPWRRVATLLRPIRIGLAGMAGLSIAGSLLGLVPPIVLGILINALVERNDKVEAAYLSVVILAAIVLEGAAYILSDGLYARNSAWLYRDLRMRMFAGLQARPPEQIEASGLASRFISDAETVERVTVGAIDSGSMLVVELVAAVIALGILQPLAVAAAAVLTALTTLIARKMQAPTVPAGQRRQEELERMSHALARELTRDDATGATDRFRHAVERLQHAEVRLGWLSAINTQGSGALAAIGPLAVVILAAFAGTHQAGTLLSLYLLSGRVFYSYDGLVDLRLSMQMVRGAIRRCFALIDLAAPAPAEPYDAR